ncbi:MAG: hypothetical protein QNL92_07665 [Octadecabacter sp.]
MAGAQVALDIAAARQLAAVLLLDSQPMAAREVLRELLRADPDDPQLLINMSRAQRALGESAAAVSAGRRAYQLATTDIERHVAARVTAQALSSDGRRNSAQFWLRRAAQFAPDPAALARTRQDFAYVAARNPWSLSLDFAATPTDNINGAPTTNTFTLGGLTFIDPTAEPISGVQLRYGARVAYRLPATQTRQSELHLRYQAVRTILGAEADSIAPTLEPGDLAFDTLELGWSAKTLRPDAQSQIDTSLVAFGNWSAQDLHETGLRGTVGYSWPVGTLGQMRAALTGERRIRADNADRSATVLGFDASYAHRLENGDRARVMISYGDTASASLSVAHDATGLLFGYDFSQPVLGAQVGLTAGWDMAQYDGPLYGAEARHDDKVTMNASATLGAISYYGFAPVIDLDYTRNHSNISTFDSETFALGLGFRSTF